MPRVVNLSGFERLRPSWDALYARRNRTNLFVTHAWITNWARVFAPSFAAAIDGDDRRLEAGLVAHRVGDTWQSLGDHSYRPEILASAPLGEVAGPLVRALDRRAPGKVCLVGTRADHAARLELSGVRGSVVAVRKFERELRVIDTSAPFETYLESRRKKVRQELRRKRRRLERDLAEPRVKSWRGGDDMDEALAAVLDIESESWKDDADTSIASSPAETRFYRGVLGLEGDDLEPRVYALLDAGRPFAYILGVAHREIFYALKCSYRASHANLSPGGNVFYYLIAEACSDPAIERIELLGHDSRWKRELSSIDEPVCLLELYRRNLRSVAYAIGYERVRPFIKQLIADNPRLRQLLVRVGVVHASETIPEAIDSASSRST